MQNNTKSSAVAGILGVFLGWAGGHDWYLGNTKKAITHVSLTVGGFLLLMVGIIIDNLTSGVVALNILFKCLIIASYVIIIGNFVWGFIEGVIIIAQGDAGLAAKGYKVADPASTTMTIANPSANDATETASTSGATTPTSGASAETGTAPSASSTVATTQPTEEKAPEPPLEPAHLDNIITATPATSGIMQASVPMNNAPAAPSTPEVSTTPATESTPTSTTTIPTANTSVAPTMPEAPTVPATPDTAPASSTPSPTDSNPTPTPPTPPSPVA